MDKNNKKRSPEKLKGYLLIQNRVLYG